MRQTRPDVAQRGVSLIELIVAMVLVGIVIAATVFFVYPVRQSVDLAVRAELTDTADNALQRIGREVRAALPNSVRTATISGIRLLEFVPVRTAGRYRADGGGASTSDCSPGATAEDRLAFGASDTCFKSIGTIPNASDIAAGDVVVLNNYGTSYAGQDVYEAAGSNRRSVTASVADGSRQRIDIAAGTFDPALHDSPGKRFFVVPGAAGIPAPVTFECNPSARTLTRRWGYAMSASQSDVSGAPSSALLANNVDSCEFDYVANVAPQVGLLTMRLVLSKAVSSGATESISLYHAVHVSNVP